VIGFTRDPPPVHDGATMATDRFRGMLLGIALGDAIGLPAEGLSAARISRRFGHLDHFRLVGRRGFVSDDTELAALALHALRRHPFDETACATLYARMVVGWLARLPWGLGMATLKAGLRAAIGVRQPGVRSAGNGALPRAAVVGAFLAEDRARRVSFTRALTAVTHTDPRAIEASLFSAELVAACLGAAPSADRQALFRAARPAVRDEELGRALDEAADLAARGAAVGEGAARLGVTGFVVHSLPFAVFTFLSLGDDPWAAVRATAEAGGDADSNAAIAGAFLGALHGEAAWPAALVDALHDGPFGPTHLRQLADGTEPSWSAMAAFMRNLALWPVILGHGFRRLLP
jgi:ADP-ribosyl-[dinitrogen reductase] hydrolase